MVNIFLFSMTILRSLAIGLQSFGIMLHGKTVLVFNKLKCFTCDKISTPSADLEENRTIRDPFSSKAVQLNLQK